MIKLWKKERWLLVPCPDYDVAAMEAWLEQQAQKGLFLSAENGFFLGFACFEVGNPKRVRYRLDVIPKEKGLRGFSRKQSRCHPACAGDGLGICDRAQGISDLPL